MSYNNRPRGSRWRTWDEVPRPKQIRLEARAYRLPPEKHLVLLSTHKIKPMHKLGIFSLPLYSFSRGTPKPIFIDTACTPQKRLNAQRLSLLNSILRSNPLTIEFKSDLAPIDVIITPDRAIVAREILRLRKHLNWSVLAGQLYCKDNGIEVWEVAVLSSKRVLIKFISRYRELNGRINSVIYDIPDKALAMAKITYSNMMVKRLIGGLAA